MKTAHLPPEARRLWKLLYQDPESDCIRGLPLKEGITESLFAELMVGCLYRRHEHAERFIAHDRRNHRRLLNKRGIREIEKVAASPMPAAALLGSRALEIHAAARTHHDDVARWAKAKDRFLLDPIVCLYVLFKYLVEPQRGDDPEDPSAPLEGIEFYVKTYFPKILAKAGLLPPKKQTWTADNIWKTFRRRSSGRKAADSVAFYLFSTDDRLKPYRPKPTFPLEPSPFDPELAATLVGRAFFRLPEPPKAAPLKPSRGGQSKRESAKALSAR